MCQLLVGTPVHKAGGCPFYTRRWDGNMGAERVPESWFLKTEEYFAPGKNVCACWWVGSRKKYPLMYMTIHKKKFINRKQEFVKNVQIFKNNE